MNTNLMNQWVIQKNAISIESFFGGGAQTQTDFHVVRCDEPFFGRQKFSLEGGFMNGVQNKVER